MLFQDFGIAKTRQERQRRRGHKSYIVVSVGNFRICDESIPTRVGSPYTPNVRHIPVGAVPTVGVALLSY
jgi:hypothetical protein